MEVEENTRFIYQFGKFVLDPLEKTLYSEGAPMHLPAKEFETLLLLVENNGRALSKEEMLTAIWQDTVVEEVNLAKQISRLRKIFNSNGAKYIETLPKHGYRFSAEVNQIFQPAEETILEKRTIKRLTVRLENETEEAPKALLPKRKFFSARRLILGCLLVLLIAGGGFWWWRAQRKPAKIDSIAVLPLKSLTGEETGNALGLGLTDALITKIGSLRNVAVRPLNVVTKSAESEADAIEIGKNLKTDAVLEGTIQQEGGRIRINVRLLRVENGEQIWAERFDAEASRIFDLEDRLSERAARALGSQLGVGDGEHLTKRFTTVPEAFDDYLKGRYFWNKRTEEDFRRAIDFFNSAVEKDPNYALAYSGLADCYTLLGVWGAETPKQVFPRAEQYAEKALQADASLAEAMVSRAFVRWVYDWDFQAADADFARAIELNANYATAHHWYSYFLVSRGRFDEAISEIKRARELEGPLNISVNTDIGEIYSWSGKYAEAETALREVLKIEPDYAVAHYVLAINLLKQNRVAEAVTEAETARRLESEPRILAVLAYAYAVSGEREKASKVMDEVNELAKQKYVSPFSKAVVQIGLGDSEAAIDELEKAYYERSDAIAILGIYPLLDDLRKHPRFTKLQQQIGQNRPAEY
jgi:DNA-binding winged helix-turn-helix (wHTH) protein/TolB-like protein/Tfp pilus assembly protein PilF